MNRIKPLIYIIVGAALFLALAYKLAELFAPGSYPYAEEYELEYSEAEVKDAIKQFKIDHPEYKVPKVTINNEGAWDLIDEQSKDLTHWYCVYFYYSQEKQIIHAWTRPAEDGKTTFALVSVNDGLNLGNWKDINRDLDRAENENAKKIFEERILNEVIKELKNK